MVLPERSGSSTRGRTPNIRYNVLKLSIVAIYAKNFHRAFHEIHSLPLQTAKFCPFLCNCEKVLSQKFANMRSAKMLPKSQAVHNSILSSLDYNQLMIALAGAPEMIRNCLSSSSLGYNPLCGSRPSCDESFCLLLIFGSSRLLQFPHRCTSSPSSFPSSSALPPWSSSSSTSSTSSFQLRGRELEGGLWLPAVYHHLVHHCTAFSFPQLLLNNRTSQIFIIIFSFIIVIVIVFVIV